ncbi:hypothetical protein FRC01_000207 [Tulasnella sp. 417]|nr:hypothetical protein FRC01_000207 [Tulasnella sp. 417]
MARWAKKKSLQCLGPIKRRYHNTDKGVGEGDEEHLINAQAACWLFEMTSSLNDQVIVAQNICSLNGAGCALILSELELWKRLLCLTVEALQTWRDQPTPKNKETVQHFACALYHLLCDIPRDDNRWREVEIAFPRESFHSGSFVLKELKSILAGQQPGIFVPDGTEYSLKAIILHSMIKDDNVRPFIHYSHLVQTPYDDTVLSLLALGLRNASLGFSYPRKYLAQSLASALASCPEMNELELCDCIYAVFLRRINNLFSRDRMNPGVREMCRSAVVTFMVNLGPRKSNQALKFPMEAILTAKSLFGDTKEPWDERKTEGFWCVLEHLIDPVPPGQSAAKLRPGIKADLFCETLNWLLIRTRHCNDLTSLPSHLFIAKFIREQLTHELPRLNGRWHKLIEMHQEQLFKGKVVNLQDLWLEAGWCTYLVERLQRFPDDGGETPQDDKVTELTGTMDLVDSTIHHSANFALKLVEEDFPDAAAGIILALWGEPFTNRKNSIDNRDLHGLQSRFLMLVKFALLGSLESLKHKWETDKMLDAVRCLSTHPNWASGPRTAKSSISVQNLIARPNSTDSAIDFLLNTTE